MIEKKKYKKNRTEEQNELIFKNVKSVIPGGAVA